MFNENNKELTIALYQTWPGKAYKKYNVTNMTEPTTAVAIFPATLKGLDKAIEAAERSDAVLVKLEEKYFTTETLLEVIRKKIKNKKFVYVFKSVGKLPER